MKPKFTNLLQILDYFKDESICKKYLIDQRWNGNIICHHCKNDKIYNTNRGYKCASCKKKFTVTTGTVMENTKLPYRYWLITIYLATSAKNGIAAAELARHLNITDVTAWFLMQRVRAMLSINSPELLEGTIQLDETFVGGKNKNRHADKKVKQCQGRSFKDKTPVMGMLQQEISEVIERSHKIFPNQIVKDKKIISPAVLKCFVISNTQKETLQPLLRTHIKNGSIVISDEWHAYRGLNDNYWHYVVDHSKKQYVNEGGYTSNALEGSWSIFKKAIIGTHRKVSKKYLHLYCNEFVFRYNTKNTTDIDRFETAVSKIQNARLTYKTLVA